MNLTNINYWFTVMNLSNLAFVTLSVWTFPDTRIYQGTTSLAWFLLIVHWVIAKKMKKNDKLEVEKL